jgi:UDP-N-acetylglucosamine 4-epimerase
MTTATRYEDVRARLRREPRAWLVTGAAGFIGSHLVEELLRLDQRVAGLDDLATGSRRNLAAVRDAVSPAQAGRFTFHEGDIRDPAACARAIQGADLVLHQAALGSVPRSIEDPLRSHDVNVTGFLRVLAAAREAGVRRVVYASSSSVYGDHPALPKAEPAVGRPLSPYAASKHADELYAAAFACCYGLELVGLRYFNVFGPRQDPAGPYAAVVPVWFAALLEGREVRIHGDGETSRDFCYVDNVVQANLLAATSGDPEAPGRVFNVACGARTTLAELFLLIRAEVGRIDPRALARTPVHDAPRAGDVRHSLADIEAARRILGYAPTHGVRQGLASAAAWYAASCRAQEARAPAGSPVELP